MSSVKDVIEEVLFKPLAPGLEPECRYSNLDPTLHVTDARILAELLDRALSGKDILRR